LETSTLVSTIRFFVKPNIPILKDSKTSFRFMKLVVTGGAGFIGSHLVKYLVKKGNDVTVIDNLSQGKLENLKEIQNDIHFHKEDILNYVELKNIIKNMDGIFHEAALTSVPESFVKKEEYHQVNVDGTDNIFKIAQEYEIKVIFASSAAIYGNPKTIPISENSEKKPNNPYGLTKLEDEHLAEKYSKSGSKIIGLRHFNVYGIGQTLDYAGVIIKFINNLSNKKSPVIFGDGSQVRDFIFVEDVVKANLAALESSIDHGFFNIGTGIATSIKKLANILIQLSGQNIEPIYEELPEGDVKESQADINLAKKMLSWKPQINLEKGLETLFQ